MDGRYRGTFHFRNGISSDHLRQCFNEQKYTDVTLVTSDRITVDCHKIVLSAFSTTMENKLADPDFEGQQHPTIPVEMQISVLMQLLELMYTGEVSVSNLEYHEFLTATESMEFKVGLHFYAENGRDEQTPPPEPHPHPELPAILVPYDPVPFNPPNDLPRASHQRATPSGLLSGRNVQYTNEDVRQAIERVRRGEVSCARAAELHNIPKSTLYKKVKNFKRQLIRQGNCGFYY